MLPEFKLAELLHALLISSLGGLVRALTRFAFRQPGARWAPLFLLGALDVLAGAFAGYLVYRLGNWARVDGELQAFYIGAAGASGTLHRAAVDRDHAALDAAADRHAGRQRTARSGRNQLKRGRAWLNNYWGRRSGACCGCFSRRMAGDNYPGRWEGGDLLMVRVSWLSFP